MNVEEFRNHCLSKNGVTEEFPFDNQTLVFKVMGKMFALCNIDNFKTFNLKCDPEKSNELRELYSGIIPGWHMNKKHWNTCDTKNDIPNKLFKKLIDDSYNLVASKLKKVLKEELKNLN